MFNVHWSVGGVFSFARQPPPRREETIGDILRSCAAQVLREYATGQLRPGLPDRMKPSAFTVYGFKRRSKRYRWRQRRVMGVERPYYSPRGLNFTRLALAVTAGNPQALIRAAEEMASKQAHMADLVTRPGGFSVRDLKSRRRIKTVLRLPGARILNRGGAKTQVYRKQLLNLRMGGARDLRAIVARYFELVEQRLSAELALATRKTLGVGP